MKRPSIGKGLFYTRDSEGKSELAPPQYVAWARAEAARLGVRLDGTPETILGMIERGEFHSGDLYLDYAISGHILRRPAFDPLRARALADLTVSHLFVPRRDRIARPENPVDGMLMERELREGGLTIVFQDKVALPIPKGSRLPVGDLLGMLIDFNSSGEFRLELARKLISAKVRLSEAGYSIGGGAALRLPPLALLCRRGTPTRAG